MEAYPVASKLSSMTSVAWNQVFLMSKPNSYNLPVKCGLPVSSKPEKTDGVACNKEDEGAKCELGTTCRALMTGLVPLKIILKVSARSDKGVR